MTPQEKEYYRKLFTERLVNAIKVQVASETIQEYDVEITEMLTKLASIATEFQKEYDKTKLIEMTNLVEQIESKMLDLRHRIIVIMGKEDGEVIIGKFKSLHNIANLKAMLNRYSERLR